MRPTVPKRLRKLRINRIDFVDAGANPNAEITLFKRDASVYAPVRPPQPEREVREYHDMRHIEKAIGEPTRVEKRFGDGETVTEEAEALIDEIVEEVHVRCRLSRAQALNEALGLESAEGFATQREVALV